MTEKKVESPVDLATKFVVWSLGGEPTKTNNNSNYLVHYVDPNYDAKVYVAFVSERITLKKTITYSKTIK